MSKNREGQTGCSHCSTAASLLPREGCPVGKEVEGGAGRRAVGGGEVGKGSVWSRAPEQGLRGHCPGLSSWRKLSCQFPVSPRNPGSGWFLDTVSGCLSFPVVLGMCICSAHGLEGALSPISPHFLSPFLLSLFRHYASHLLTHLLTHPNALPSIDPNTFPLFHTPTRLTTHSPIHTAIHVHFSVIHLPTFSVFPLSTCLPIHPSTCHVSAHRASSSTCLHFYCLLSYPSTHPPFTVHCSTYPPTYQLSLHPSLFSSLLSPLLFPSLPSSALSFPSLLFSSLLFSSLLSSPFLLFSLFCISSFTHSLSTHQ